MPQKAEIDLISLIPIELEPVPMPEDVAALLAENAIELEPGEAEKMGKFLAMPMIANDSMNLTAVTDPATGWRRHIADALMLLPTIASFEPTEFVDADGDPDIVLAALKATAPDAPPAEAKAMKLVDVGTGGGLPGIPLAIALPDVHVTLMEATGKKVQFLRLVKKRLALKNVDVVHVRAEAAGQDHKNHRERYDIAVARAVGSLAVLVELVGPLVKVGGLMLAVKGEKAEEEVALAAEAIEKIGLSVDQVLPTPTSRLVLLPKVSRTPRTYPRRDGEPSRVPIGIKREARDDKRPAIRPDAPEQLARRSKAYGGDGPPRDGTPRGTRPGGGGIGGGQFGDGHFKDTSADLPKADTGEEGTTR